MKKILGTGKYLQLVDEGGWEYVERVIGTDVAVVLPIDGNQVILIEQFRPALGRSIIELPAGLVGDLNNSESVGEAAHRELLEETGFIARNMRLVSAGPPSSGITNEVISLFVATGLEKVSSGGGDETENIKVHSVLIDEIDLWIEARQQEGCLIDPKIFGALYFAIRERR